MVDEMGRGLIIDIHGHAHDHQMSEIGYHFSGCRITYLDKCDPAKDFNLTSCSPPFQNWNDQERKEKYSMDTSIWQLINEKNLDIRDMVAR